MFAFVTKKIAKRQPNKLSHLIISVSYTQSDAADDQLCVDLGGRRNIKKKKSETKHNEMTKITQEIKS